MKKHEVTLGKLRDHYLLILRAAGASNQTQIANERVLRFLIDSSLGFGPELPVVAVKEEAVLHYLIARKKLGRRGRGLKHSTLRTEFLVIRSFFEWTRKSGHIKEGLLKTMKPPRPDYFTADPLTDDEIVRIFRAVRRSPQNTAIVALLLDAGLRRREVYELPLAHIDQENLSVRIFGKGRKWRTVPYGRTTAKILERHLQWRELVSPKTDRLFVARDGGGLSSGKMQYRLTRIRKESGVTRLYLHLFRITYATRFLLNGGDMFLLKANLGHTTFYSVGKYIRIADSQDHTLSRKASVLDRANRQLSLLKRLR